MSARLFSSEAYPDPERGDAWRDVVRGFGLDTSAPSRFAGHATALSRCDADGVSLMRFAAAPQTLSPRPHPDEMPLAFVSLEGDVSLRSGPETSDVPRGQIAVLPRRAAWELASPTGMRGVLLSVAAGAFAGRFVQVPPLARPRVLPAAGLSGVLSHTLQAAAATLDKIADDEWRIVGSSIAEMLLALCRGAAAAAGTASGAGSQTALMHRICEAIERRLHEPDLTPASIARDEGISERYLQKVLESAGHNFSSYLRERRLHHCRADLESPAEARFSVSEIAFRRGFNDAAHFSRTFRDRFGASPRELRQRHTRRISAGRDRPTDQRGWPRDALAQPRSHKPAPRDVVAALAPATHARERASHHHLAVEARNVHWGYFDRALKPLLEIASGDTVTIETLSQHASDDPERMIEGDPGALDVFRWTRTDKAVERRGAGPLDASIFGRGAGEGFGVHICTGPIAIADAQPGDVVEVRILDIVPRESCNPAFSGRAFGSSVAAWWGYHYGDLLSEPKPREIVTIYEIFADDDEPHARAVYSYRWQPQTDPFGTLHRTYDYPGVAVRPETIRRRHGVLDGVRIPLRPHFGVIAVAPREAELVDSIPPAYFGGNLDNWRLGKGASVYLPVSVAGALLSIGDPHAAQGDGELAGTAIECSMTGTVQVILHKRADLPGTVLDDINYPLIEIADAWIMTGLSYPNHLTEFGTKGQSEVYSKSSLDLAMKDAFRKARRFLVNTKGLSEDEAIALISAAVDFGVTQVVDGNWGIHAIIPKRLFDRTN